MQFEADFRFDMDDSFSLASQRLSSPSTATTKEATVWPVDPAPSAETLPRYPQASISSVRLAAGLKRKHVSSNIRKNNYPTEQYTPSKAIAHYTISQDCTAGFGTRKRQLLADFGKKSRGGKNHFGYLGNMRPGPDYTYRQTDATDKKVSQFADSGVFRTYIQSLVDDRTMKQAQRLRQSRVYQPGPLKELPLHQEGQQIIPCPYPGCSSRFSTLSKMRKHQRNMGHDVEDEDPGIQKRQRFR